MSGCKEQVYLGVHIDNKLDWGKNTDALYKKGQSRLYFLRRLRSFNICRTMLRMFYESVVASAILYAVVCWGSRLRVADANRLNRLIRRAGDVVGGEAGPSDGGFREENASQGESHHGQCVQPTPRRAGQTQELFQLQTDCTKMHYRAPQEVIPACGHQTVQLLTLTIVCNLTYVQNSSVQ